MPGEFACFPSIVSSSPGLSQVARRQFTPFVNRRITSKVPLVCMSSPVRNVKAAVRHGVQMWNPWLPTHAVSFVYFVDQVNVKYLMKNIEHVTSFVC